MKYWAKITDCLKTVFPATRQELFLFAVFVTAYGILATDIAFNYTVVFDNRIPWDAYFSFDNRAIVMTGGGFERHPLSNYLFEWIREIAFWYSDGKRNVNFRMVLAWFSVVAVSLTMVQIFKYLKNIICLPNWLSWLIVLFFAFFSTNILLSFTPETYTYTLLVLAVFNYYSALKIRKDEKLPLAALTLATVSLGGLTITNAAKPFIPLLFEKKVFTDRRKFLNAALRVLVSVAIFILLYLNRLKFDYQRIFDKMAEQFDKFSGREHAPFWDMAISWFFGGNILFSNFYFLNYHNKNGFEYKALFMDVYSSVVPYLFVGLLLALVIWAYIRNFKNSLVQILMITFLFNIVIHLGLKFGLDTAYIYGGHFVFVYPMMIGWLFQSYRTSGKMFSRILAIFVFMTVYLIWNNLYRMQEFYEFLNAFYQ